MTYAEIKRRLSKCERMVELIKSKDLSNSTPTDRQKIQKELKTLNENIVKYNNLLLKEEKTYILTPKSGKPTAASLGDDEVDALKGADDIEAIKAADGEEIKEQDGIEFSIDETKAIAKKVGKAVAKSLKALGDSVTTMKAHRLEPNSFDIHVEYKNGKDDEFSFYISGDTLHLVDFSFDKELVDVGVKPSGEAIVHVDHLANELQKHFKSLSEDVNEMNYSNYTKPKHFDICPGAEALRDELIKGGKSPEDLGEWTFLHDELFRLEKAVIKANKADERHIKVAKQFKSQIINLSRDLGIEANKIGYLSGHVKKIEDIASKTDGKGDNVTLRSRDIYEGEGDDHHYLKVSRRDYKKTMSILDNNVDPTYVKTEVIDDDGAGNVIIYFIFRHEYGFDDMYDDPEGKENPELYQEPDEDPSGFMYDVVMDLQAQGIEVVDHSAEMDEDYDPDQEQKDDEEDHGVAYDDDGRPLGETDEAMDVNDPVLMRMRVAKKRNADLKKVDQMHARDRKDQRLNGKKRLLIKQLKDKRAEIEREMENDPEIEPSGGPVADRYGDMLNKIDNAIEKAAGRIKPLDYDTAVGLREDDEEETDYIKRRREEDDYYEDPDYYKEGATTHDDGGDLDVGHQDDEPSMLKASAFETAEYAAKLVKKLAQYDKHDGEVDFPNWWQKKLILARDYMSAAFHYLDSEEKQPAIDKLALEEAVNESTDLFRDDKFAFTRFSMGKEGPGLQVSDLKKLNEYIHVSGKDLDQFVKGLMKAVRVFDDMKRQLPVDEGIAKVQKAHGLVVAKMKELAKQYKAGDKSVVTQLKDLTVKKKSLEARLEKAVAGTGRNQELTELSGDQRNDLVELQNILDDVAQKGEEAREIIRQSFPRMLSKADAYGAFDFGSSANRYDTTLSSIIEEIEEYYDEEEDVDEGKYKSDAQRKAIYATKAEKGELKEGATCCGRCGRVHVKGSGCKRPYLKGKSHCRNK